MYASCPGRHSGGAIRTLKSDINEDLQGRPQLVFTFDNRFGSTGWAVTQSVRYITFCLQASYLSATSHTGGKSCRVKSLYMKRFWSVHHITNLTRLGHTVPKILFMCSEKIKLRGLDSSSYSHVSLSNLYIPRIGLPIWLQQNRQIKIAQDT